MYKIPFKFKSFLYYDNLGVFILFFFIISYVIYAFLGEYFSFLLTSLFLNNTNIYIVVFI